jgi:hypothetical protein
MRQSHPFQEEMMRKTKGWPGLRSAVIALGLVAWTATAATASPLTYTTSGQVTPTTGVSGTNVISFVPLNNNNTVDLSSGPTNVGLGNFVITPLAAGTATTYKDTPFQINFLPASYNGAPVASDQTVTLSGVFNGTVSGPSSSTVQATFNNIPSGMVSLGGSNSAKFSLPYASVLLAPSTSNSGTTSVQGLITPNLKDGVPAPEPSTIALLITTVGGLGLRRFVHSRRRSAKA